MTQRETIETRTPLMKRLGRLPDWLVWRNYVGKVKSLHGDTIFSIGTEGQPDLYAVRKITVTPEMVGTTIGVAYAIETKVKGGKQSPAQRAYESAWQMRGGIYRLCDDPGSFDLE